MATTGRMFTKTSSSSQWNVLFFFYSCFPVPNKLALANSDETVRQAKHDTKHATTTDRDCWTKMTSWATKICSVCVCRGGMGGGGSSSNKGKYMYHCFFSFLSASSFFFSLYCGLGKCPSFWKDATLWWWYVLDCDGKNTWTAVSYKMDANMWNITRLI